MRVPPEKIAKMESSPPQRVARHEEVLGCARVGLVRKGMQVHGLLWKMNFGFDVLLQNSLIGFFVRYGCVELARQVFDRGEKFDYLEFDK
ncbi:hypothetical protein JHK85_023229 [Glycine max]|nr:hypothetical protein JHK85_023229 [Glycine max]